MTLKDKTILITGGAVRIGRALSLAVAKRGATVILHYAGSQSQAEATQAEIKELGGAAHLLQADFKQLNTIPGLFQRALEFGPLYALVNNSAIFEPHKLPDTSLEAWQRHLDINLTAPFLLSQAFAASLDNGQAGRIVNLLDWRALRPGPDHLPYTVSKAGLAALTRSLAISLAPNITVNALALGAILPPSDGSDPPNLLAQVPAGRLGELDEVQEALIFLLEGPAYITGEILHIDGGRHLT